MNPAELNFNKFVAVPSSTVLVSSTAGFLSVYNESIDKLLLGKGKAGRLTRRQDARREKQITTTKSRKSIGN
jgi:hypothetical protein